MKSRVVHGQRARLGAIGLLVLVLGACTLPGSGRVTVPTLGEPSRRGSFAPVVEAVSPAIVSIAAERIRRSPLLEDPLFRRFLERLQPELVPRSRQTSLGSGVVVDPAGYVVTNHHVVDSAQAITVLLADGRALDAEIVSGDAATDLALLRVVDARDLPAIAFADSEALRPGDLVLALGNPFGIGQSVSAGIVSAIGRRARGLDLAVSLIQTDAAINPGNSGGALVDVEGRLVGINTAILTRTGGSLGVGFAIPSNVVRDHLRGAR